VAKEKKRKKEKSTHLAINGGLPHLQSVLDKLLEGVI